MDTSDSLKDRLIVYQRNEITAQENYRRLKVQIPEVDAILEEEHDHEERLVGFFDEEHLRYAGSIL